jgi:hypothetical protein
MASYEVESADLEFVYRINDDKFHRIWMVQMLTLSLTQCRGVKPQENGVNHTAVKTPRLADLCYMFYALDKIIYLLRMWCDNAVGNYMPIEPHTHFSTAHHIA